MVLPVMPSQKKSFSTAFRSYKTAMDLIDQVHTGIATLQNATASFSDQVQTYLNLRSLFSGKNASVADLNEIPAFQDFCSDFQEQLLQAGKSITLKVPKPNSEGGSAPLLINDKPATLHDFANALSDNHTAFTVQVDLKRIDSGGFSPYWGPDATNEEGGITWNVNHSDFWGGDFHITAQGSAENWIQCASGNVADRGKAFNDLANLLR